MERRLDVTLCRVGVVSALKAHCAVILTAKGILPTGIVATTLLVAVRITETLLEDLFAT